MFNRFVHKIFTEFNADDKKLITKTTTLLQTLFAVVTKLCTV